MSNQRSKPIQDMLKSLLVLYQNKEYVNAENLALSIIEKYPNNKHAWKILAGVFEQTNRVPDSLKANQKALKIDPHDPEIYLCLGNNFNHQEKLNDAELNYKKAIELNPNYLQAFYNLGLILKKMQRFEESVSYFKKLINLKPDFVKGYNYLSVVLIDLKEFDEASVNLKKAIALKPDYHEAFFNLGVALRGVGLREQASDALKKAIDLKPDYIRAYNLLGVTLAGLGQYEDAIENYKKAISIDPSYVEAYNNLANTFKELGRFEETSENYKKAVDIKPDYAEAYKNWGLASMLNYDFEKAFELMEWRLQLEEKNYIPLKTSKPRWDGFTKNKVFVWKEQGIGDHIMFSSMISELHAIVEKVIVECDPRLLPLFQRSFSNEIKFITDRDEISEDDYDCHLPIGSLAFHFRKTLNDFEVTSKGWLQADPERVQSIRQNFMKSQSEKIVGLSWNTKSITGQASSRKIKLDVLLMPLKELGYKFVNLQYGDVSEEISNLKLNHGIDVIEIPDLDLFNDIDGLAATIAACDYVISIANLNPHLAGALNVNTNLLLPYAADERWGYKKNKSYWYNSISIYRQKKPENWKQPLSELVSDLSRYQ